MTHSLFPLAAIIVLTWNQRDLTLDCLASLVQMTYPADRLLLIVVDNGSADGTAQAIRERYPQAVVLENGENLGFAGGNNVGIRYAMEHGAEYIGILNNDVAVTADFLVPLLTVLQSDPAIGIATPLLAVMDQPEQVWALGSTVNWRTGAVERLYAGERVSTWRKQPPFAVDAASGAAMLVKRQVFETVGLMDEDFFLYYEETDWCLRVQRAGYQIMAVPSSQVLHKVSAALGETSPVIDYYMLRNHLRFVGRNWMGLVRRRLQCSIVGQNLLTIAAYTVKPHGGARIPNRNARLLALRDALLGRWGKMGPDVAAVCYPQKTA